MLRARVWTSCRRVGLFRVIEGGGAFALVALFDIGVGIEDDDFLLPFKLDVGGLDGAIPALLTLPLVKLAHRVDLSDNFSVDCHPLLRIKLLLIKHAQV